MQDRDCAATQGGGTCGGCAGGIGADSSGGDASGCGDKAGCAAGCGRRWWSGKISCGAGNGGRCSGEIVWGKSRSSKTRRGIARTHWQQEVIGELGKSKLAGKPFFRALRP
jgi:hypothetical protein